MNIRDKAAEKDLLLAEGYCPVGSNSAGTV